MNKTLIIFLLSTFILAFSSSEATTIGLHGIQSFGTNDLLQREQKNDTQVPVIGIIFDEYGKNERSYLNRIVSELGTGRIYHISLSPFGHTAQEVDEGIYDTEYNNFFKDIKALDIKVVFRTMHEMNGGWYSRASHPQEFQNAWRHVWRLARKKHNIQKDKLLFSLSFNSQDLPTTDARPTQESAIRFCSEREVQNRGRCPRKADYYPGNHYVDMIGVTLYNRGRSRPDTWSKRKSPKTLLEEDNLVGILEQRNKPIIIDELGSTAINFEGDRSAKKAQQVFQEESLHKNQRLQQRQEVLQQHPLIKAIIYFNIDATAGASKQVLGQAERSIILSKHHRDYKEGTKLLTQYNQRKTLEKLFISNKKKLLPTKVSRNLTP